MKSQNISIDDNKINFNTPVINVYFNGISIVAEWNELDLKTVLSKSSMEDRILARKNQRLNTETEEQALRLIKVYEKTHPEQAEITIVNKKIHNL
jgi:hypothetical protein